MKHTNNIEESIRKLRRSTTSATDERILNDALAALEQSTQSGPAGRVIKGPITKFAVATVIVIAVFTGIKLFTSSSEKASREPVSEKGLPRMEVVAEETKEAKPDSDVELEAEQAAAKLEAELKNIEQMFAAGDVNGLVTMLWQGQEENRLTAAIYLAKIGDLRAVGALEKLSAELGGDEPNNLFAALAYHIRSRLEQEKQKAELAEDSERQIAAKEAAAETKSPLDSGISTRQTDGLTDYVGVVVEGIDSPNEFIGVVVDENDNPLENVLVDAWTSYSGNEMHTDANGFFRLDGFKNCKTIEVRFSKENYSPRLIVRQPLGVQDAVVVLDNKTYFEGQVKSSDEEPAPGAVIRANQGPKQAEGVVIDSIWTETVSDEQGNYRLYVQNDKYDIQIEVDGVGVARIQNVVIEKNETKQLDIVLGFGVTFQAEILDSESSEPVEGVRLFHWQHPGVEGLSDANGFVEIDGMLPGRFEFNVEANDYTRWWSEQCLSEWNRLKTDRKKGEWQRNFDSLDFDLELGMEPVIIVVERSVRIRGKVLDPNGNPVAGATVAPALTGTGNSITGDTRFSVSTEEDGSFEMLLPAGKGREYNLVAHDGKYQQWRNWANGVTEPILTEPGEELNDVEVRLSESATVLGRVTDKSGQPITGRKVRASAFDKLGNRYYDPTTETDENGYFELKFIRPGRHYIQVKPFWLSAETAPKETSQIVDVEAGETIEGVELVAGDDKDF